MRDLDHTLAEAPVEFLFLRLGIGWLAAVFRHAYNHAGISKIDTP